MSTRLQHSRYQFTRWIATGGMGEVWAAEDTLLDREVAVKVLKREYAEDPVLHARFAAEARHAGALQHPHVASVLDYGELVTEDQNVPGQQITLPFLVMELVDGKPLSALLAAGVPLSVEAATDLVAQAAEGVGAAHEIGIVHRDVKPGNLLVTEAGQVKVTDFGVARAADAAPLTLTGHLIGTPHYLSPEQAEGGTATPASDVYALGIVLFECLTGSKPFLGESPVATALMQIRDPLPPMGPSVPERLQQIVSVATAKDPTQRFTTAGALAAALRDDNPATRTFVMPAVDGTSETALVPSGAPSGTAARVLARPWPVVAAVTVLVVVLAAGWWATRGDEPSDPVAGSDTTEQVQVQASSYVGLDRAEAARRLRDLGLDVGFEQRANPGTAQAGTVADVSPTGAMDVGTEVSLTVWGQPTAVDSGSPDGDQAGGEPGKGKSKGGKGRGNGGGGKGGKGKGGKG